MQLPGILDYFFSPSRPVALAANLVILAIATLAAAETWTKGFRALRLESEALARLRDRLDGTPVETISLGPSHGTADQIDPRSFLESFAKEGSAGHPILSGRIRQLQRLRMHGDNIDQGALSAIVISQLDDNAAFARWSSTAVVLLGLTGTLVGLTQAVRASALILGRGTSATIGEAVQAVTRTFDGVQVAFSATLMGAMSAIVLGVLVTQLRKAQGSFVRDLEEFTTTELLPRYRTSAGLSLSQTAHTLAELQGKLRDSLSAVLTDLTRRGEQLVSTIEYRFDSLTTKYDERSKLLLESFESTQQNVTRLLGTASDESLPLAAILETLRIAATQVQKAADSSAGMIPVFEESLSRQIDRQTRDLYEAAKSTTESVSASLKEQSEQLLGTLTRLDAFGPALAEIIARQVDNQTKDLNESLHAHRKAIETTVANQSDQIKAVNGILANLKEAVLDIGGTAKDNLDAFTSATTSLQTLATDLRTSTEENAKRLESLPTAFATALGSTPAGIRPTTHPPLSNTPRAHTDFADAPNTKTGTVSPSPNISERLGSPPEAATTSQTKPSNLFQRWFKR